MTLSSNSWKKLFLFCLGLTIGSAFCMKWMEGDLWVNGEKFSIMGLELFYPKEKVISVLAGLDDRVRTILSYHLHFDFAFMAGVYPGIAALCMMARAKMMSGLIKKSLFFLAVLQLAAWAGDIAENMYLLKWLKQQVIGNEFGGYHFIVTAKWLIALTGALVAATVLLVRRKKK